MSIDTIIFDGKSIADMFSDVYRNTNSKREQINAFINSMTKLIRTPEDAAVIGPIIKDFLEVNVKNDEHVVRLVQIAQRLVTVNTKTNTSGEFMSEEEKAQILRNIKSEFETVMTEQDDLETEIENIKR